MAAPRLPFSPGVRPSATCLGHLLNYFNVGMATAQFRFDTSQLAAESFISELLKKFLERMKIKIYTVGGTIDKVYFDRKSKYEVGEPKIEEILQEANVNFEYEISSVLHKDSLNMTDQDRQMIFDTITSDKHLYIIVTHGTDTMIQTAQKLNTIPNKVIVLTGAIVPARFKSSDASFNIGCAVAAVQTLTPGVYIAMNGRIFDPNRVRKNPEKNWFETVEE